MPRSLQPHPTPRRRCQASAEPQGSDSSGPAPPLLGREAWEGAPSCRQHFPSPSATLRWAALPRAKAPRQGYRPSCQEADQPGARSI